MNKDRLIIVLEDMNRKFDVFYDELSFVRSDILTLKSGFERIDGRLGSLESGQLRTDGRLDSLQAGQLRTDGQLDSLQAGQLRIEDRLERIDEKLETHDRLLTA